MKIVKRIIKKFFIFFGLQISYIGKALQISYVGKVGLRHYLYIQRVFYKIARIGIQHLYMQRMFDKIAGIEGDIVECGIGKMGTFQILASLLQEENSARKLWGFDSFEGFPEPSAEDSSPRNPQKGEWKYIEAEDVAKFLIILGFGAQWIDSHVKIVKGFFRDTLPNNNVPKIALLHLDADLYDSYKTCLQYLFPRVVRGGVVLFDEYLNASLKFPGAKKAIDEYFSGTEYELSRDKLSGKYFLVKS